MKLNVKDISVNIPRGWDECSIKQLEIIAQVIIEEQFGCNSLHTFDWDNVRQRSFLLLADIRPIGSSEQGVKVEMPYDEDYQKSDILEIDAAELTKEINRTMKWMGMNDKDELIPFALTIFPYSKMKIARYCKLPWLKHFLPKKSFHGAETLMQDYSWERYRWASDFMKAYLEISNEVLELQGIITRRSLSDKDRRRAIDTLKKAMNDQDDMCAHFLSTCFTSRHYVKGKGLFPHRNYLWDSDSVDRNSRYFHHWNMTVRWQVILIWWQSMQPYLQSKYPKCFSIGKKKKGKEHDPNPLELYTRTIATMEKYLGLGENDVNQQNFQIILQHINDMAMENDEIKKMKGKK